MLFRSEGSRGQQQFVLVAAEKVVQTHVSVHESPRVRAAPACRGNRVLCHSMHPDRSATAITAALLRCFLAKPDHSFTDSPPPPAARSLPGYWRQSHYRAMADVLVVGAVIVFVAAMLGMTWALGRL